MAKIIAGRFDATVDADAAIEALRREGFSREEIDSFYVGPAGQHDMNPWGGDSVAGEGARHAGKGAMLGVALGALAGLALGWAIGTRTEYPWVVLAFCVGVGAYVGSFLGAMRKVRGGRKWRASIEHPVEPKAGRLVAVNVDRPGSEGPALEVLGESGARDIGRASGTWRDGWKDFDPRVPLMAP